MYYELRLRIRSFGTRLFFVENKRFSERVVSKINLKNEDGYHNRPRFACCAPIIYHKRPNDPDVIFFQTSSDAYTASAQRSPSTPAETIPPA